MVAFCAIYIIQSINRPSDVPLSDWDLFRLATLFELTGELELQAAARHPPQSPADMNVVDAMARQIRRGLDLVMQSRQVRFVDPSDFWQNAAEEAGLVSHDIPLFAENTYNPTRAPPPAPDMDVTQSDFAPTDAFMSSGNNAMPFIANWDLQSLLPDMGMPWHDASTQEGLFNWNSM
jgi:hypothetical protein